MSRLIPLRLGLFFTLCAALWLNTGCARLKPSAGGNEPAVAEQAETGEAAVTTSEPSEPSAPVEEPTTAEDLAVQPIESAPYLLRTGDPVIVFLRGILPKDDQIEDIIDEKGYINLPYIDEVLAAGKTTSALEKEIQQTYIRKEIYRTVTVNVVMPSQSYFVRGEVKQPGRFQLITGITVLQAIASAGGYTEFADAKRIRLIRAGKGISVNVREIERNPEKDQRIESGDVIVIPRSYF